MNVQLNLLPDIKKTYLKAQRTKKIIISASIVVTLVAGGLIALAGGYVYGLQPALISSTNKSITKKVATLKAIPDVDSYLTVQNQLSVLTDLHENKPVYSRLFDYLKILNPAPPNAVQFSSLQVGQSEKSVTVVGTTASYQSFTVFIDTLKNAELVYQQDDKDVREKLFTDIAIDNQSVAKDGSGVTKMNFTLHLTYNENAFSFTLDNVKIEVPNMETTQSVINAPGYDPSKIFDANAKQQEQK